MKPPTLPILYTGSQFRFVLSESGCSIKHLSDLSGVSRTQINEYMNGDRNLSISTYRRLINALAQFQAEKGSDHV